MNEIEEKLDKIIEMLKIIIKPILKAKKEEEGDIAIRRWLFEQDWD